VSDKQSRSFAERDFFLMPATRNDGRRPRAQNVALAAVLLAATAALAQPPIECSEATACEFQVYIENDRWSGTDRYYTNGIKFGGGVRADRLIERIFQAPAEEVLDRISGRPAPVQVGLFLGQNLYTPEDIKVAQPQPFDRPWAAWLYVGGVAQRVLGDRLRTVEIDIGMVGPAALGSHVQTEWHRLVDAPRPRGWHNQLRNEPGLLVAYFEKWRFGPATGVQLVPHAGITLGNVMTLARAGGTVRLGAHMSGFGPDTIEPGGAMLQRTRLIDRQHGSGRREWYLFAGFDARAVGYNIFLDGNLLRSGGPSVDRRVFVHDLKAGASIRIAPLRISLTHVRRSEEFTTPLGRGGSQRFQSLNVSWEF
jgi:hypothetical protein